MKNLFLATSMIVLLGACSSMNPCGNNKTTFLNNFETFIEEIESEKLEFADEKWENYDLKFRKYVDECYDEFEDDLTRSEESDFAANTVKYYYVKYGQGIYEQYKDDGEGFINLL